MPVSPLEIFAKLDGIDGESTARGHEKETVIASFEQGQDHPAPPAGGGGGAAGRTTFPGVRFRKPVDAGSIPLIAACVSGTRIRDARFTFRRAGATPLDFYHVTLDEVLVTRVVHRAGSGAQYPLSFDQLDAGAESGGLLEEVTLSFTRIHWEYQPIRTDGTLGPAVRGGWDLVASRSL
ncbi:MAG: type VI secretion system tube protein Hcp [Acidobacteria bacterium]|nr:type VI secretion system tube protein Hcp [Acidobacteriota bacterium]